MPAAAVVIAAAVLVIPGLRDLLLRSADVGALHVRGNSVLVLLDTSGSMGADDQIVAQQHLDALAAGGIPTNLRYTVNGSAIADDGDVTFLPTLFARLIDGHRIDAVYLISDYLDSGSNNPNAERRFTEFLRDRHIRMYWATVGATPLEVYRQIGIASGGGIIPPP